MDFGRPDYDTRIIDTANRIPADEPLFLLRGCDPLAADLVKAYAMRAQHELGFGNPLAASAYAQAEKMEAFLAARRKATFQAWDAAYTTQLRAATQAGITDVALPSQPEEKKPDL